MHYILASASPRRKELLTNMGIVFDIVVSNCEETVTEKEPVKIVRELSRLKAFNVKEKLHFSEEAVIIAADTLVFLDDERLGKPKNEKDAVFMLLKLSGRSHKVITGVTLIHYADGKFEDVSFAEETEVWFSKLSHEEIADYVKTGEPMDKAGAYAIQGLSAKFVERINGDYSNVVGLPVPKLYSVMKEKGWI